YTLDTLSRPPEKSADPKFVRRERPIAFLMSGLSNLEPRDVCR
ncbi:probable auxin efflux carrier component 1c, partial [Prevotella sp. MGM1]